MRKREHYLEAEAQVLNGLFRKSVVSYTLSDVAKSVGPMVDMTMIGLFLGVTCVTANGYIVPLMFLYEVVGTVVASGTRSVVSSMIGAMKIKESRQAFSMSLILGIGTSALLALLTIVFRYPIAAFLGARDPAVLEATVGYLAGFAIGLPFMTGHRILTPYLQMEGNYRKINVSAYAMTIVDVLADLIVIFVFHAGMFGIGLATSIGYIVAFVIIVSHFFNQKRKTMFRFSFRGLQASHAVDIIRTGAAAGVVKGSNSVGGILINNMLTACGVPYLVAAYGVLGNLTKFVRSAWYASTDTMLSFASVFIGEEDRISLKRTQRMGYCQGVVYSAVIAALMFLFAKPITLVFLGTDDPVAVAMSVECIRFSCLAILFNPLIYGFNNYLMAVKHRLFGSLYSFLIECGLPVVVTFFALRLFDYHGAWIAKPIFQILLCLIALLYILRYKGTTFSDRLMLLPETFGSSPDKEIYASAETMDEIMGMSRIAVQFAMENGADKRRAEMISLMIEEMAGNVVTHGFADGKKHSVSMRLIAKKRSDGNDNGHDLILRMRDDGKPFNPVERYDEVRGTDDSENLGLKIVMGLAKDVQYISTFGANNLIVRI